MASATPLLVKTPTKSIDSVALEFDNARKGLSFVEFASLKMAHRNVVEVKDVDSQVHNYELTESAFATLASWSGFPKEYVRKLPDDLYFRNVGYGIEQAMTSGSLGKLKLVVKDNSIISWTDRRWKGFPATDALKAAASAMNQPEVNSHHIDSEAVNFSITSPDLHTEFKLGDVQFFSVGLRFPDLGTFLPEIVAQGNRVVCGNLMPAPYGIQGRHFKIYDNSHQQILDAIREFTRRGVDFIKDKMIPQIQATLDQKIDNSSQVLKRIVKQFGIPHKLVEIIDGALRVCEQDGAGSDTMYGIVNALTRAANNPEVTETWANQLRWIAGNLTMQTGQKRNCSHCYSVID